MSQNDSERAVACTLTEKQEKERSEDVQSLLISQYVGYEELENGVAVRFDRTDELPPAVAQFVSDELQCCSFAEYKITVAPPYEEMVLTITGPEGTRQLFQEGFIERLAPDLA